MVMAASDSFADVMAQLRQGDNKAAAEIFRRFSERLVALARSRLAPQVRQKIDPEDVLQSVFRSFFNRQAHGQVQADSWESLWSLLVVITLRKCGRRWDYFHAARRDIRREVETDSLPDASGSTWQAPDPEPTPEEAAMLTETVEQLMSSLEGRQREILTLSLQGLSPHEISDQLGCTERTVYRVLERIREWLQSEPPAT
jgi:RNA polymerase sigma-70 factor (ECF subfamily)